MSSALDELPPPAEWSPARLLGARPALLRHVSGGRIALAMGVRQVACHDGAVLLYVADGTRFKSARALDGSKQRSLSERALADGHLAADSGSAVVRALDDVLARLEHRMAPFRDDRTVAPALGPGAVSLPAGWDSIRT